MSASSTYHHGDLKNALVQAALDILASKGIEALSLRSVALRAGVSHAAPAHHFRDVHALRTAVAARGFDQLAEALRRAREAASDSEDVVRASVEGYVAFARSFPGLFTLMFSPERVDTADAAFRSAGRGAYAQLEEAARTVADANGTRDEEGRTACEYMIWSVAHGYAHLVIAGLIPKPGRALANAPDIASLLFAKHSSKSQRRSKARQRRPAKRGPAST